MVEITHSAGCPKGKYNPPKMLAIAEQLRDKIDGACPYLRIKCDDNMMSHITIHGSFDNEEDWTHKIFQNSRYFIIMIQPERKRRYYDPSDKVVTVGVTSKCYKLPNLRKYTGPPEKVIEKIYEWIRENNNA